MVLVKSFQLNCKQNKLAELSTLNFNLTVVEKTIANQKPYYLLCKR